MSTHTHIHVTCTNIHTVHKDMLVVCFLIYRASIDRHSLIEYLVMCMYELEENGYLVMCMYELEKN